MELVEEEEERIHLVLEEFPFEDDIDVNIQVWRCPECEITETTYDA